MKGRTPRGLAVLASTVLVGVALAACGGGGSTTTSSTPSTTNAADTQGATGGTGSTGAARRTALEACLKKYGVTLPAGGGFGRGFGATGASGHRFPFGATGASGRHFPFGATGASGRHFPFGGGGFGGTGASGAFGNSKLAQALQKCGALTGGYGRFGGTGGRGPAGFSTQVKAALTSFVTCMRKHGVSLPTPNLSGTGSVFGNVNETTATFKAAFAKCESVLPAYFRGSRPPTGATGSTATT